MVDWIFSDELNCGMVISTLFSIYYSQNDKKIKSFGWKIFLAIYGTWIFLHVYLRCSYKLFYAEYVSIQITFFNFCELLLNILLCHNRVFNNSTMMGILAFCTKCKHATKSRANCSHFLSSWKKINIDRDFQFFNWIFNDFK